VGGPFWGSVGSEAHPRRSTASVGGNGASAMAYRRLRRRDRAPDGGEAPVEPGVARG